MVDNFQHLPATAIDYMRDLLDPERVIMEAGMLEKFSIAHHPLSE